MRRIYKYPLARTASAQTVKMSPGEIVHVALQHDLPTFWALVDPEQPPEVRTFCIFATGEEFADRWQYVGTFFSGQFVWHICEATA